MLLEVITLRIVEFSNITGLSKRTLQYYDSIGILKPLKESNGYRNYTSDLLVVAENIKFLKELDYSLIQIKKLLSHEIKQSELIETHISFIKDKITNLNNKIEYLQDTKEGANMKLIKDIKNKYKKEVENKWRNSDAYKQSVEKTSKYNKKDWSEITTLQNELFNRIHEEVDYKSEAAQLLINEWQSFITKYYYKCTDEILLGLADMYVSDRRFKKRMNKARPGLAEFFSSSIKYHKGA